MYELIDSINTVLNNFIWGAPAMVCIIGVGLYLSCRTGFIQLRKLGYALKNTLGKVFSKSDAAQGTITPFQAVCTALAATVRTGNIAGVAGAIAIGGPGAVFWMWISALVGGPMYYIKNGLGSKWIWLTYLYAAFGAIAVFLLAPVLLKLIKEHFKK